MSANANNECHCSSQYSSEKVLLNSEQTTSFFNCIGGHGGGGNFSIHIAYMVWLELVIESKSYLIEHSQSSIQVNAVS